jgi:hypothetical protein
MAGLLAFLVDHRQSGPLRLDRALEVLEQSNVVRQPTPGFEGALTIFGTQPFGNVHGAGCIQTRQCGDGRQIVALVVSRLRA